MSDVAKMAGVSLMTVSRVINGTAGVSERTRNRVVSAMKVLEYTPNLAARTLATGKSATLGVLCVDAPYYGPASTLFGVALAARKAGYFVSVATVDAHDRDGLTHGLRRLRDHGVAGLIVIAPHALATETLQESAGSLPVVAVSATRSSFAPVVGIDQESGAAKATSHLLSLGHATVWHVAGPSNWLDAQARETAWRKTLEAAGAVAPQVVRGDWSSESGYEWGVRLARDPDVTAVFAGNDQMALGLLRAFQEHGRSTPADVSVVGFDDLPEAAFFSPPLTTVRQDFEQLGRRILMVMLEQLDGEQAVVDGVLVQPELILRSSTAPPS